MVNLFSLSLASLHVFLEALSLRDDKTGIIGLNRGGVLGVGLSSERPSLLKSLSTVLGSRVGVNSLSREDSSGRAESRCRGESRSGGNEGSKDDGTLKQRQQQRGG